MPALRFTDRAVRGFDATGARLDFWDLQLPGFGVRVTESGRKTWFVRYRIAGKQRRFKLGHFPDMSLSEAREEAREKLGQAVRGDDPKVTRQVREEKQIVTVRTMADAYIEKHAKRKKRSWQKDAAMLKQDVLPIIGNLHPDKVEQAHIVDTCDRIITRGCPTQANRVFEVVRKMFNWGRGTYLRISPCYGMAKPAKERPRARDLQPDEIRTIWQRIESGGVLPDGRSVTMLEGTRIALKLLLLTGQRVGEVTQAPKAEFNLVEHIWTIPGERTKNQRLHRLPLPDASWKLIERAIELSGQSEWLFPSPVRSRKGQAAGSKPIGATSMNHALSKVIKTSGVSDVRPHDFREVVATSMAALGVSDIHIDAVQNHVRGTVSEKHYIRYRYEKEKLAALQQWHERLEQILGESVCPGHTSTAVPQTMRQA